MPETPDPTGPDERDRIEASNTIAAAVEQVQGFTPLDVRYDIADKALEGLITAGWTRTPRPVTVSENLAEHIRDARMEECEHYVESLDRELCCSPCLRDRLLPHLSSGQSEAEWEPTKLTRAVGLDGEVWAESSSAAEVRTKARPGDRIERLWERAEREWWAES